MQDDENPGRRRYPRINARLPLLVRDAAGGENAPMISAEVRTLATNGCMFVHDTGFSSHARLQLSISLHGWVIETAGRVIWQRPAEAERGMEVGVQFLDIEPKDSALIEEVLQRIPLV